MFQDSRNNTYTCLRSLGQENTMFCRFEDSEQMLEMYNLNQDRHQLTNLASMLTNDTIAHYLVSLLPYKTNIHSMYTSSFRSE